MRNRRSWPRDGYVETTMADSVLARPYKGGEVKDANVHSTSAYQTHGFENLYQLSDVPEYPPNLQITPILGFESCAVLLVFNCFNEDSSVKHSIQTLSL